MAGNPRLDFLSARRVAVAQSLGAESGMMLVIKPLEIVMSRTVRDWGTGARGSLSMKRGMKSLMKRGMKRVVMNTAVACTLVPMWAMAGTAMTTAGAVEMVFLQCACLCVEGVPQTLCSSVEEAQQRPSVCGQQQCPDYVAVEAQGSRYVSPHAFADNCRDVRVWDAAREAYDGIKVCDVLELSVAPTRR